jgi:hypothetical protein
VSEKFLFSRLNKLARSPSFLCRGFRTDSPGRSCAFFFVANIYDWGRNPGREGSPRGVDGRSRPAAQLAQRRRRRIGSGQSEEFIDGVTGRGVLLCRELLTYAIGVFSARALFNDVFIHRCFQHRPPQELAAVETLESRDREHFRRTCMPMTKLHREKSRFKRPKPSDPTVDPIPMSSLSALPMSRPPHQLHSPDIPNSPNPAAIDNCTHIIRAIYTACEPQSRWNAVTLLSAESAYMPPE